MLMVLLLTTLMRTVSALSLTSNKYKYYLANGACIEYALSSDSSIIDVLDKLASNYFQARSWYRLHERIFIRPDVAVAVNKEIASRSYNSYWPLNPFGVQEVKFETPAGPVTIIVRSDLEWPLFMGTEQELKDNSFNIFMEKILAD
jgi:hypothetical protein